MKTKRLPPQPRQPVKLKEAAKFLGLSPHTLRRYVNRTPPLIKRMKTPSVSKFGGHYVFDWEDLEQFKKRYSLGEVQP